MKAQDDWALLYRISQNYYINEYSQNDIASMENISRPQISRLLKRAREIGIVDIRVSLPESHTLEDLENKVANYFGLEKVVVAQSHEDSRQNDLSLYFTAANYLKDVLPKFKNIGIGWGRTMYNVSLNISYKGDCEYMTFYSIVGSSGTNNPFLQVNNITDRFAERFSSKVCYNNSLTFSLKKSLDNVALERLKQLKNSWSDLDAIVFGIGGKNTTDKLYIDEIPIEIYNHGLKDEIVGDILGNFFLEDASELSFPQEYELLSMDFDEIKKNKCTICIMNGYEKVDAVIIALKNKLIKNLITDENTIKHIIKSIES